MAKESEGLISALKTLRKVGAVAATASGNRALTAQLKSTQVTPLVLVESSLTGLNYIEDLHHSIADQYASMYFAVASRYLDLSVNGAKVTKILQKLATERDYMDALGNESYAVAGAKDMLSLGFEAARMAASEKLVTAINDVKSLSVGKIINLEFSNGEKGGTIPAVVNLRLNVKSVNSSLITDIFEANVVELNPLKRIRMVSMGERTWLEAITCSREIAQQNRIRLQDREGLVRSNFMESAKELGYVLASGGEVPINTASGVNVITDRTLATIERVISGNFEDYKTRQKFFANTATFLVCVIDQEEMTVTFYYRDSRKTNTVSLSSLERSSGKKNDLDPMVKELLQGGVPSLR